MKSKSGLEMWTARVHEVYATLDELRAYCRVYSIARRLGYRSAKALWTANPIIGGTVNPYDLCIVHLA